MAAEAATGRRKLARILGHSLHLRNAVWHYGTARQRRGRLITVTLSLLFASFGITGLLASGADCNDEAIQRACRWLVKARLADGGWGEAWQGLLEGRSVPHARSQVIMTSWALIALLRAGYQGEQVREAIAGGIQLLKDRQLPHGDWPEEAVAGVFFNTAMLHYRLYKNYFPIWALGLYDNTLRESQGADNAGR